MFTLWQRVDIHTALVMEHLEAACSRLRPGVSVGEGVARVARRFNTSNYYLVMQADQRGWM